MGEDLASLRSQVTPSTVGRTRQKKRTWDFCDEKENRRGIVGCALASCWRHINLGVNND